MGDAILVVYGFTEACSAFFCCLERVIIVALLRYRDIDCYPYWGSNCGTSVP
jgi:hypothetical protein